MDGFKPAHKLILTKVKGRFHVSCCCGLSLGKWETEEEAIDRYHRHTGVVEKSGRR